MAWLTENEMMMNYTFSIFWPEYKVYGIRYLKKRFSLRLKMGLGGKCRWHFVCSPSYNRYFLVFLNVFRHCAPWIALQQFASQWIAKVSIIANLGRDIPLRQPSSFEINPTTSNLLLSNDLPWKLSPSQYGAHSKVLWRTISVKIFYMNLYI